LHTAEHDSRAAAENLMNAESLSQWLESLPIAQRIAALALVYSRLTVATREFFLPGRTKGKEQTVLNMLHGVNELHHTLANCLIRDSTESELDTLSRQLLEIASQYWIEGMLSWAIESVRSNTGLK
jgi:hypothetical protein